MLCRTNAGMLKINSFQLHRTIQVVNFTEPLFTLTILSQYIYCTRLAYLMNILKILQTACGFLNLIARVFDEKMRQLGLSQV